MILKKLVDIAKDKTNFTAVGDYVAFAQRFADFLADSTNVQAIIVAQNERQYRFFQYKADGHFNITRPINAELMVGAGQSGTLGTDFLRTLTDAASGRRLSTVRRKLLCNAIYTLQQSIGAALDALPSGSANNARKVNGDLFERLIKLLIQHVGVDCTSGSIGVPVTVEDEETFTMNYQHDLIVRECGVVKIIGSVKTSSKDRIDKVFIDKFLYGKLSGEAIPHIAVFLNDVQRKRSRLPNNYGVSSTFLPGRFKGYTIKLNPLDGVYYCDLRPNMARDPILAHHIRTIDHLFCSDLRTLLRHPGDDRIRVE